MCNDPHEPKSEPIDKLKWLGAACIVLLGLACFLLLNRIDTLQRQIALEKAHSHVFTKWDEPKEFLGTYKQFRTCKECGFAEGRDVAAR